MPISEKDLKDRSNLLETTPGDYIELIGLTSHTPEEVYEILVSSQEERLIKNHKLSACAAIFTKELGFEHVSTRHVNPNFGIISLVESKEAFGIKEYPLPADSLPTNELWNIPSKDLHNYENSNALEFIMQFLRTNGEHISMKYRAVFKTIAEDNEKEFFDGLLEHINGLSLDEELPKAREVLQTDRNPVNRSWALLIMMRSIPTDDDISLLFKELMIKDADRERKMAFYVARESLKLTENIRWENLTEPISSLLNGGAIWFYQDFLDMLTSLEIDPAIADQVINGKSPILRDNLNSFDDEWRDNTFNFIKHISNGEVKTKEQANTWLAKTAMSS